jgi:hypothetical protein
VFALQNDELLAEGKVLKHQAATTAKAANEGSETEQEQVKHGSKDIAEGLAGRLPKLLISKPDGVLTRDKCHAMRVIAHSRGF